MSRIDIAEVTAFHRDLQQMNREARSGIKKMERAARNYAQDNSLKGQAVTTSKRYFSESYQTICDTVIEVMNESEHLLARYIQDFHSQVDPSPNAKIDAEMLQTAMSKVKSIERKKGHLQQSLSGSTAGLHEGQMQLFRVQLAEAVKQEKILEKYIHFEQSHGSFFSTVEELVHRSGKAIRQLLRETTFNEKTGTIHLPKGYGKSLKDLKKSLAKARGIDPKMDKKLKGYTVYAVVVPGANGKSSVMWVTEKDGLAVNEADLQSYLDKCGKYLKPSEYYVIPNEVLLQKINDAWKHGQYYLDGKAKFGAGAKGILSASAYVEDWAERFNKSEFGQAVLGLGLSMASIRYRPVIKKASGAGNVDDITWSLNKKGAKINGRDYSGHALERMAPNTPEVRAQLRIRAQSIAKEKGLVPGTDSYHKFVNNYIKPRNVPPMVVEDAIQNGTKLQGNRPNTWSFETNSVKVITNDTGKVITVISK